MLDVANNDIEKLANMEQLRNLEDFWVSGDAVVGVFENRRCVGE